MNKIIARAWDGVNMYLSPEGSNLWHIGTWLQSHSIVASKNEKESIIMFFTGVTTRSNQKIFDGDIIMTVLSDGYTCKKVIQWRSEYAAFMMANIDQLKDEWWTDIWQPIKKSWMDEFIPEIIGNIHQNPELLEK